MQTRCLDLPDDLRQHLELIARLPTTPQGLALRARCVLMVAGQGAREEHGIHAVAGKFGLQPKTVRKWVCRVADQGVLGLCDASRPGRPRRITALERCAVIDAACSSPAEYQLAGYTQWSGELLAKVLKASGRVAAISGRTANRILHRASLKPHRIEYLKRRRDPDFDAKAAPILDLYLHPPQDGVVVCADEMTAIQALERVAPDLPMRLPGQVFKREFEYLRHGTRCLTAGLMVHSGQVVGLITERRPKAVFIAFLDLLNTEVAPGLVIHLVVDNLNTHPGDLVQSWMLERPGRLKLYYLPFYASWLNQVELWLRTLQRRCLARASFNDCETLALALTDFIATYNRFEAHPYRWTYTGEPLAA